MVLPEIANNALRQWQKNVAEGPLPPKVAIRFEQNDTVFDAILINPNETEVTLTQKLFHDNKIEYDARVNTWRTLWAVV